ncbi:hypothetical protein VM1G_07500 [Cytospora mali]|uniref:Uncharacterized protein n=1 Tax=Cytospora mali TaxID=578113 RepID=A0A194W8M9_CYTMA|nr:hypothetical protein VM1G_07500 [Valsa mali]
MECFWPQIKKHFQRERAPSSVKLVDRTNCPAFLNLKKLTDDPDLHRYITGQARQLKLDLELPDPSTRGDLCRCPDRIDRELSAFRLGKKISGNEAGWQGALARRLVSYITSHLSANIDGNIPNALTGTPLDRKEYCPDRPSAGSPVAVIEAATCNIGDGKGTFDTTSVNLNDCFAYGDDKLY